jgi:hypothetical protein
LSSLQDWLKRVQAAKSRSELFAILNEFRPLEWTDDERATMAKSYIRLLDGMKEEPESTKGAESEKSEGADGPVWYEKM